MITGAASGIGAACALRFAAEGARIAGFDVAEPAAAHRDAIEKAAPGSLWERVDVRDEASIERAVAAALAHFGRLDLLVNAAGVSGYGAVDELAAEEWDRVLGINLRGTYLVSKHVVRAMKAAAVGQRREPRQHRGPRRHAVAGGLQRLEGRCRAADPEHGDRLRRVSAYA